MPDRSAAVRVLCAQHPEAFPQDATNDAARLTFLQGTIIPTLNTADNGNWGYMTKTDQGNKVPCDILMWRPTNDVVDCMTGTGGAWIVHGKPPDAWVWTGVPTTPPTPIPPEPIPPDPGQTVPYIAYGPLQEQQSVQFGQGCNQAYADTAAAGHPYPPDAGMIAVHAQRAMWSYLMGGMTWDQAYLHHINEFRAEYHLPPI